MCNDCGFEGCDGSCDEIAEDTDEPGFEPSDHGLGDWDSTFSTLDDDWDDDD